MTLTAAPGGGGDDNAAARLRASDNGAAPSDVSPRVSVMETVEELWHGPRVRAGLAEEIGGRRNLEDACVALDDVAELCGGDEPAGFYAVFDGHGGRAAALYAREHLLQSIVSHPGFPADVPAAMRAGLHATDEALRSGGDAFACGTTAVVALLLGRRVFVANLGDSRAVLCRRGRCIELSSDHKPVSESERSRIEAAGGFVDSEGYLCGTLGVSRALGDWLHVCARDGKPLKTPAPAGGAAARSPLSAEADIREQELTSEDEFLILACDGLWDVISSQNAVQLARSQLQRHNDPALCAADLAREAIEVRHAADNVTVVAVCLSAAPPPVRASVQGGIVPRGGSRLFARSMSQDLLAGLQRMIDTDEPDSPTLLGGTATPPAAAAAAAAAAV